MPRYASTVVEIALGEVGYLEKKSNKNLDSKTANAGSANFTKYGRDMHELYPSTMDFPAAWCDAFNDWCFEQAYGVSNAKGLIGGRFDDYTPNSAQLYKNKGAYHKKDPKVGDQIFFHNGTRICHTGIVYKVDEKYVYTVEGNTSGASGLVSNGGGVAKKKYPLNYEKIDGYGRPKYDPEPKKEPAKTDKKSITEVAKEVIAGKYGTGTARKANLKKDGYDYDTVQKKVNELLKEAKKAAYYEKYTGSSDKIDTVFKAIGVPSKYIDDKAGETYTVRKPVAAANGISNYKGTAAQNTKLINLAKKGKLKKA